MDFDSGEIEHHMGTGSSNPLNSLSPGVSSSDGFMTYRLLTMQARLLHEKQYERYAELIRNGGTYEELSEIESNLAMRVSQKIELQEPAQQVLKRVQEAAEILNVPSNSMDLFLEIKKAVEEAEEWSYYDSVNAVKEAQPKGRPFVIRIRGGKNEFPEEARQDSQENSPDDLEIHADPTKSSHVSIYTITAPASEGLEEQLSEWVQQATYQVDQIRNSIAKTNVTLDALEEVLYEYEMTGSVTYDSPSNARIERMSSEQVDRPEGAPGPDKDHSEDEIIEAITKLDIDLGELGDFTKKEVAKRLDENDDVDLDYALSTLKVKLSNIL